MLVSAVPQSESAICIHISPLLDSFPFRSPQSIELEFPVLFSRFSLVTYFIGGGNGNPLQYSCLENPMDGGAWWAAVHGVTRSRTRLSDFTLTFHFHALEKDMATHLCSCLENPRDSGAWWAAVYGVA